MKLYRTPHGPLIEIDQHFHAIAEPWDTLLARPDLLSHLTTQLNAGKCPQASAPTTILAPILTQEVWAAGVTYLRSRNARMEESKSSATVYDRVYEAERPELFFKAAGHRVIPSGGTVRIRRDSKWNVPEPELTLLLSSTGKITGFTIGNDMSSRDIEGENPLYLPQAKIYDGSCALGPCIYLTDQPLPPATLIKIRIVRKGEEVFAGQTEISRIKRPLQSLADYLYRETSFPNGCFLMTGTGVVPNDSFTLASGDQIAITINPIGTLINTVA